MPQMAETIDFEAEGLLANLEGEDRESRLALLKRLEEDGADVEELRIAVAQSRLAVLPVERLLAGEPKYTAEQVSERSGVPIDVLERQWRSLGLAIGDRDETLLNSDDVESAHRMRTLLDAGIDEDAIAELGRTIAVAMSQFAAASRQIMADTYATPDDREDDVSDRLAESVQTLFPLVGPTLDYVYKLHLREQLRHAVFTSDGDDAGPTVVSTIGFADLVGFTSLGEELQPEQIGQVTGRLDEISREVATGPVRLVKLIGDAAMLVAPDTPSLLEALHDLLEAMGKEGEGFPLIRAGVACGPVVTRGGDFYGSPVNVASRVTGIARPGSMLVTDEVRAQVEDSYDFSRAGRKHLKGINGTVELFRCRRQREDDGD